MTPSAVVVLQHLGRLVVGWLGVLVQLRHAVEGERSSEADDLISFRQQAAERLLGGDWYRDYDT